MKTFKRISQGFPLEIEWEQSSGLVYRRTNFQIVGQEDGQNIYSYDETVWSIQEFLNSYLTQVRADLDYISMMAEVDL